MTLRLFKALGLAAGLALTGCSQAEETTAIASMSAYNHTADYIHQYYINGQWGGNSRAYGGGGSFVCCIIYPRQWHEGLSATVRWSTSDTAPYGSPEETWHEKVVPIERYEAPGTRLNVHFLPSHEVRLIIWNGASGTSAYPGPPPPVAPEGFWEDIEKNAPPGFYEQFNKPYVPGQMPVDK
ncbi:hypothetical protein CO611_09160 [Lysobacteraceae bacterium NML03-0222]|nr:hypothetical protein CO611_09160 [Xanthomonadaceae bacterium NML03-0222]